MIAKHVPMKSVANSDFVSLVRYLCDTQRKQERLGWVSITNCCSRTAEAAAEEVRATQARNTRARSDRTYHLIVSFRPGEHVDEGMCHAIAAHLCDGLGFGAHQRVSAAHYDTDNLHLHIAINKIHPTRYTIHNPYYDHWKLGRLCEELERQYGLQPDNHCRRQRGAACRAADMERHAGVESLIGWIRRRCHREMLAAPSWPALHRVLHAHGLVLRERGIGLVVLAGDGTSAKASSIDAACSKPRLETRLGAFEPAAVGQHAEPVLQTYEKKPLPSAIDTTALYARYLQAQQQASALSAVQRAAIRARQQRQITAAKQRAWRRRAAIRLLAQPGLARKALYWAASKALRDDIAAINQTCQAQRAAIGQRHQRSSWADWLRERAIEGDREALAALRARRSAHGLAGNTVAGILRSETVGSAVGCDGITKNGTVIYHLGSAAVRDDGDRLTVSRDASLDELRAVLRMAVRRYGAYLHVSGTIVFQNQVAEAAAEARLAVRFDNAGLEMRRQRMREQHGACKDWGDQTGSVDPQQSAQSALRTDRPAVDLPDRPLRRGRGRYRRDPYRATAGP